MVAFSQCGIAYCNVPVMKNIENKIMNHELSGIEPSGLRCQLIYLKKFLMILVG